MKRVPALLTIALAGLCFSGALDAQVQGDDPPKFRSSADLVTIQASVKTTRGRPVKGLTSADFDVLDNGQPRPILSLRADSQSPVSLAILIDTSGSMAVAGKVSFAQDVFDAIVDQLRPSQDEVGIFSFDSALHEHQPFTSDVTQLNDAFDDLGLFGSTSLYDAAAAAAQRLADRSATHKAIVVLTDGVDTSSALTAAQVSALASSVGVPVYVMATVPAIDRRLILDAGRRPSGSQAADLRQLAEWTGGMLLFTGDTPETTKAATRLLEDLRQQYVIAIEAAGVREWRRLDIRVKRRAALVIKARNGYFGG